MTAGNIRRCRPVGAALSGAVWGAALYGFSAFSSTGSPVSGLSSLLFLTAIPAVYTYLGAHLTQWIGFSPFVLGVGWMGVELALRPLGLELGLLAGTQSDCAWLAWVGRGLGYVVAAFAVAYVNALLLELLSRAVASIPCSQPYVARGDRYQCVRPQAFVLVPRFHSRSLQPRAPPAARVQ